MNRAAAELIGTVFYIGKLPLAPGTWASMAATICWFFLFKDVDPIVLPAVSALLFLIGVFASDAIIQDTKEHDPSRVVIDEWVGQWLAFSMMPVNITTGVVGLIAFRIFDIVKPGPVRRLEKLPGGWGIMTDDVMAGIMAYFVLLLTYNFIL
ncbi:MAG: phosphatidylglycerophosphatase A [Candidatus Marinimicrobia bacterium]|jgi:phosphatidylglycerophosphatase A|nr:phosphatidylglycerophosphatase A [Candidatus Neomarinimicrobiota bacterium]MBT3675851.1 phosphatidylglycerophosphatase A [Candidatus Neomarinimicrobiota bacterium]MBT3763500.1 phosphatidylglycerophosphatase A [Candidatus Neomarinimicrobiota bacterium]MBT4068588.1 phosphatidylglycerophosphatase A [Candidatus Neomarinimicrobiota bacterium]MBT4271546.1 phosphatidylglycerophosphatase A [Candidatus Neomarinimicrobiota bacterium]